MRTLLVAMGLIFSNVAWSAEVEVGTSNSIIAQLLKYSDASSASIAGDLLIDVSNPADAAVCRGAFMSRQDAQYADVLQMAISAQASGAPIRVLAESTRLWPGSTDKYCCLMITRDTYGRLRQPQAEKLAGQARSSSDVAARLGKRRRAPTEENQAA